MHDILELKGTPFQSLYHFTVGLALTDERLASKTHKPHAESLS